jgi:hypothetical protein
VSLVHGRKDTNLVDVGCDVFVVHLFLGDALLVDAHGRKKRTRALVDLCAAVADDADDNLLPRVLAPRLAVGAGVHELDVLDDANHGARKQLVFLVVHGDDNEQLRRARLGEELLAQGEALGVEFGRVAGGGRIAHVGELVALRGLRVRNLVQQPGRDGAVEHEVAVEELDFLDRLPPPDHGRGAWRWRWFVVLARARRAVARVLLQHRPGVCFVPELLWLGVLGRRLVRLVVVGVVVFLGIDGQLALPRGVIALVLVIVAIRVVEALDGILAV